MPLIQGIDLAARVRNTRKLLVTAALVMSVFLMSSSIVTTLLIESEKFREGGEANGRALAYLAHKYLGNGFGSLYDASTILILAFAGASAMAGLLNLIPRYLPRFGMAPEWARAARPLVLVFMAVATIITLLFDANVDAQGGAYATGVLVLIASAAAAVTIASWKEWLRWPLLFVSVVFLYTTLVNIHERPEAIKIAGIFIGTMVVTSVISRALRSTDDHARTLLSKDDDQVIHLVAHRPRVETEPALDKIDREVRDRYSLDPEERIFFLAVLRGDASQFEDTLRVTGQCLGRHAVLRTESPVVANAIAALLIHLEKTTGRIPHAYFNWTEGNPVGNCCGFSFWVKATLRRLSTRCSAGPFRTQSAVP